MRPFAAHLDDFVADIIEPKDIFRSYNEKPGVFRHVIAAWAWRQLMMNPKVFVVSIVVVINEEQATDLRCHRVMDKAFLPFLALFGAARCSWQGSQ